MTNSARAGRGGGDGGVNSGGGGGALRGGGDGGSCFHMAVNFGLNICNERFLIPSKETKPEAR